MKKNSKHQVMKFTYNGEDREGKGKQLYEISGGIVVCQITGCDAGEFNAEFFEQKRTSKGFVMQMRIKGDVNNERAGKIYSYSGRNVELTIQPSQMSIDEFYGDDEDEGLEYSVNGDGTVEVNENQTSIFDDEPIIPDDEDEDVDDELLN